MEGFLVTDIESMGIESTSVILSAAILYVDLSKQHNWTSLYENALFVKFSVREQVEKYKRTTDKGTIEWWNKQCDLVKQKSFFPSKNDMLAVDGISCMREYIARHCDRNTTYNFVRGSLDQICLDSLCTAMGEEALIPYANYMDVRTYVNVLATKAVRGYCDVPVELFPNSDRNVVLKHNPLDDIVLDALMILNVE